MLISLYFLLNTLHAQVVKCETLEVLFPPAEKCFPRIVELLDSAKKTIYVQAGPTNEQI